MLDPKFFTNAQDIHQLQKLMTEPAPYVRPSLKITNWGIILRPDGALGMLGCLSRPQALEGVTIKTEPIWQLSITSRLIRTSKQWITLDRGYHEDVPADIEVEAVGPDGQFVAPCVAERYLQITLDVLAHEQRKT